MCIRDLSQLSTRGQDTSSKMCQTSIKYVLNDKFHLSTLLIQAVGLLKKESPSNHNYFCHTYIFFFHPWIWKLKRWKGTNISSSIKNKYHRTLKKFLKNRLHDHFRFKFWLLSWISLILPKGNSQQTSLLYQISPWPTINKDKSCIALIMRRMLVPSHQILG